MSSGERATLPAELTDVERPGSVRVKARAVLLGLASSIKQIIPAAILALLIVAFWQFVVWAFRPASYLLPSPGAVWSAIWAEDLQWPAAAWITIQEVVGGFLLGAAIGIVLGVVVAWSPLLERTVLPLLVAFNTLPKVAIAPLFIIYFGYGVMPNIAVAALVVFFPVVLSMAAGLIQVDPTVIDLARTLGAPKRRIFIRLRLPSSVPYLLVSLKLGAPLAVTGAVFGEFIASQNGLGNMIISTQTNLNMDNAFAALFWLAWIGLPLYGAVELVAKIFFPWARGEKEVA